MASLWKGSVGQLDASVFLCRPELRAGLHTNTRCNFLWFFFSGALLDWLDSRFNFVHWICFMKTGCHYFMLQTLESFRTLCFDWADFFYFILCEYKKTFYFLTVLFYYLFSTFGSPLGPYSSASTIHFIRLHAAAAELRDFTHSQLY